MTAFLGCSKDVLICDEQETDSLYAVRLSFEGVPKIKEDVIDTKSNSISSEGLLGIQVYNSKGLPYAYGLFDDISDIIIYLERDNHYRIICMYLPEGKQISIANNSGKFARISPSDTPVSLFNCHAEGNHSQNNTAVAIRGEGFEYPFLVKVSDKEKYSVVGQEYWQDYTYYGPLFYRQQALNIFTYSNTQYCNFTERVNRNLIFEQFYGEVKDMCYSINNSVSVQMKRISYRINFIIDNLPNGYLKCQLQRGSSTIFSDQLCSNMTIDVNVDVQNINDFEEYVDCLVFRAQWTHSNGMTQDLGYKNLSFKLNTENTITISF